MICDSCGKNKANIHLIKAINNHDAKKMNLCNDCAKNLLFSAGESFFSDLAEILSSILEIDVKFYRGDENKKFFDSIDWIDDKKCHYCGTDLKTIKKIGKVGCPNCYDEFKDVIYPLIKSIHGKIGHMGKVPCNSSKRLKNEKILRDLKFELDEAVIIENFERAAQLRDMIKKMQKKLYKSSSR